VYLRAFSEGTQAVIEVADEGPGIAPEHIAHIFERFYRSDEARSREAGGAGLGLAISKRIVEAHDGVIEVESDEGKGTMFRVRLPLATMNPEYLKRLNQVNKIDR